MLPYFTASPTPFATPTPTVAPTVGIWRNESFSQSRRMLMEEEEDKWERALGQGKNADGINTRRRRRRLQTTPMPTGLPTSEPTSSPTSGSCKDGCAPWMVCDYDNDECVWPQKTCPANCSALMSTTGASGGECHYYNVDAGVQVDRCTIDNSSCKSVCNCYYGYYGPACEYNNVTEYNQYKAARANLLGYLKAVTDILEPSRAAVTTWLTSLSEVSERPEQLDSGSNTTNSFFPVLKTILTQSVNLGVPYEDLLDVDTCVTNMANSQAFSTALSFVRRKRRRDRRYLRDYKEIETGAEGLDHRHLATNETLLSNTLDAGMNVTAAANNSEASDYAAISQRLPTLTLV